MYLREIVLGENWSYTSTVSLNRNTFWIKPLYQWKIKTESVRVGSNILSHFNCANKMIYYYLLYCTHFIAGIHCQGIQKLQVTLKLPSTVIYLKHVSNIILIDSLQNFSPTIVFFKKSTWQNFSHNSSRPFSLSFEDPLTSNVNLEWSFNDKNIFNWYLQCKIYLRLQGYSWSK